MSSPNLHRHLAAGFIGHSGRCDNSNDHAVLKLVLTEAFVPAARRRGICCSTATESAAGIYESPELYDAAFSFRDFVKEVPTTYAVPWLRDEPSRPGKAGEEPTTLLLLQAKFFGEACAAYSNGAELKCFVELGCGAEGQSDHEILLPDLGPFRCFGAHSSFYVFTYKLTCAHVAGPARRGTA